MGIGRQSLYDTFGDKWQLYRAALRRYATDEIHAHLAALRSAPRALDGIGAMIDRVVEEADKPCLGVNSICEFGNERPDLEEIKGPAGRTLYAAIIDRVCEGQAQGDVAAELDPEGIARFLDASFAGIRIAARGGASAAQLRMLGDLALRALR